MTKREYIEFYVKDTIKSMSRGGKRLVAVRPQEKALLDKLISDAAETLGIVDVDGWKSELGVESF